MGEQGRGSWKRSFNTYAPLAAVAVGLIIVLSSLLVENMTAWYVTVGAGVVVVLVGSGMPPTQSSQAGADTRRSALRSTSSSVWFAT